MKKFCAFVFLFMFLALGINLKASAATTDSIALEYKLLDYRNTQIIGEGYFVLNDDFYAYNNPDDYQGGYTFVYTKRNGISLTEREQKLLSNRTFVWCSDFPKELLDSDNHVYPNLFGIIKLDASILYYKEINVAKDIDDNLIKDSVGSLSYYMQNDGIRYYKYKYLESRLDPYLEKDVVVGSNSYEEVIIPENKLPGTLVNELKNNSRASEKYYAIKYGTWTTADIIHNTNSVNFKYYTDFEITVKSISPGPEGTTSTVYATIPHFYLNFDIPIDNILSITMEYDIYQTFLGIRFNRKHMVSTVECDEQIRSNTFFWFWHTSRTYNCIEKGPFDVGGDEIYDWEITLDEIMNKYHCQNTVGILEMVYEYDGIVYGADTFNGTPDSNNQTPGIPLPGDADYVSPWKSFVNWLEQIGFFKHFKSAIVIICLVVIIIGIIKVGPTIYLIYKDTRRK